LAKGTNRKPRPKREKKADRLVHGKLSAEEIRCDYALAPFDRAVEAMDTKWGVDRLVELVSPGTAQKWGSAMAKLNDAITENDPAMVTARVEVCLRGLKAMDEEATLTKAEPASGEVWEVELNGELIGIMRDARAWKRVRAERPELTLMTLREVAIAIVAWRESTAGEYEKIIKGHFPNAEVTGIKIEKKGMEDAIPF
jgi:hypothetical protein